MAIAILRKIAREYQILVSGIKYKTIFPLKGKMVIGEAFKKNS